MGLGASRVTNQAVIMIDLEKANAKVSVIWLLFAFLIREPSVNPGALRMRYFPACHVYLFHSILRAVP